MSTKKDTTDTSLEESSEKKRPESKYNASTLRECIKEELDAKSIMERMGIAHKPTLKHYVLRLISDDRTFYDVKGLYLKSSSRPYVNKKGEVHCTPVQPRPYIPVPTTILPGCTPCCSSASTPLAVV